jgi:predicted O-linked N-acetylglucosamine transferase (SPINDLY family)
MRTAMPKPRSPAQLVALAPEYDYALGSLIECRLHCCDWTTLATDVAQLIRRVETGERAVTPFAFLAMTSSVAAQLRCARTFTADKFPPATTPLWVGERYHHDRIRVAYLSADFREHPLTHLTTELFEQHDRRRFETIGVRSVPIRAASCVRVWSMHSIALSMFAIKAMPRWRIFCAHWKWILRWT